MKHFAIDIHTHVEFAGTFDILKKRYSEEEIFDRFAVSVTGRPFWFKGFLAVNLFRLSLLSGEKSPAPKKEKGGCPSPDPG